MSYYPDEPNPHIETVIMVVILITVLVYLAYYT